MFTSMNAQALSIPEQPLLTPILVKIAIITVIAGGVIAACMNSTAPEGESQPGVLMELPERVGAFVGKSTEISEAEKRILPGDTDIVRRVYEDGSGRQIICSIVLSGGEKRSIHRPEICLPSQGWTIGEKGVIPIQLASGNMLDVMKLNLTRQVEARPNVFVPVRSQFLYWFIGKNKTTPNNMDRILLTSWDRVFHKVNHRWAYVQASMMVENSYKPGGLDEDGTTQALEAFLRDAVQAFQTSEIPKS